VLNNDFDFDGDALTVTGGTFVGTYGTLTLNCQRHLQLHLVRLGPGARGSEAAEDIFNYTVTDNDGSDTGALVFHIAGLNDAPPRTMPTRRRRRERDISSDVLANDTDVDNGAVRTVTASLGRRSAQGTPPIVDNQIAYDPGSDFDTLAVGESAVVTISYTDRRRARRDGPSTLEVTVKRRQRRSGRPNADAGATSENATVLFDVLGNGHRHRQTARPCRDRRNRRLPAREAHQWSETRSNSILAPISTTWRSATARSSSSATTCSDEHGATSASTLDHHRNRRHDAPVANPDTRTTSESSSVAIDVLANDVDVDREALLTVTNASVPAARVP
jgi:hypothetical protein